ncbi:MAG: serine/threonine protein kinase [Polyangiaceae bacterium]|nr:serine/threonine protein kinase [Polyangiaceae bacterium]
MAALFIAACMSEAKAAASAESKGLSSANDEIPLPRVFGRLLLLKLLARGGMGDVFLAATTGIEGAERPIIVKTVRRDHIHDGSFLARFLDEARVQSQLNHPGVAQILEASTDENGEPYTVVEYVEGRSLAELRQRAVQTGARIGWPEAVAIAIEMGQALAHVHERASTDGTPLGIVHRDLSPQNVMIGHAGEVKLIDFGTARGHNRRCHTVAGVVFAKPGYVAPEVARQQIGDGRIDVYAMGVMLWELCAGKRLLSGEAHKHLEEVAAGQFRIPELAKTCGVPSELDAIIQKLCADDPDERYASASVASTDLARVLGQAPASKRGERSTRSRISALMRTLWSHEPARSRAQFAKLLKEARELHRDVETAPASGVMAVHAAHMQADASVLSGTPYRLLRKIGEGASGEVFEAEHTELGRRYAVKVLSSAHAAAHDAVERFRREARAIAKLSHANLVRLHDFGKSIDGRVFLAMELLEGETLDRHADKGMGWRAASLLAIQAARALEAAHGAGLVHRDLKPQNLFLTTDGDLKLLDFGVAMAVAETNTAAGDKPQKGFAVFGTPEYMAPEQVAGETVDARCDLYALGCVLYELVTGSRPFEGSAVVVMGKQLREEPERPRERAPNAVIPSELEAIVLKALAKSKDARFASAKAMREALEKAVKAPDRRRSRARSLASAALLASIGAIGILSLKDRLPLLAHRAEPAAITSLPDLHAESPPEASAQAPSTEAAQSTEADDVPAPAPVHSASESATTTPRAVAARRAAPPVRAAPAAAETNPGLLVRAAAHESPAPTEDAKNRLTEARAAAREHATDPRALKAWGIAALRAGETREARRAADAWAARDDSVEPRILLAGALDASGRHREARTSLEEWIANHPDSPEAKKMLARLSTNPEPAIKRTSRSRTNQDPGAAE